MAGIQDKIRKAAVQAAIIIFIGLVTAFLVNELRPGGLPVLPGNESAKDAGKLSGSIKDYSADECLKLLQEGKVVFLDAREEPLYVSGHLPGALHVPKEMADQRLQRLKGLEQSGKVLIAYCDGQGCLKAEELLKILQARGLNSLGLFADGWIGWMDRGLPFDEGRGDDGQSTKTE